MVQWDRPTWERGRVLAGLAVVTAGMVAFHRAVPNSVGHLGSLLEQFLPWLGLVVVVLLVLALLRRSTIALVTLLLPVAADVPLRRAAVAGGRTRRTRPGRGAAQRQ